MLLAEKRDPLLSSLLDVLPCVARVTAGFAGLAGSDGVLLRLVDSEGREYSELPSDVGELVQEAIAEGCSVGRESLPQLKGSSWALPLGRWVLFATNSDLVARQAEFRSCLENALPLIAKVAGGEAVIFNRSGVRLMSVFPDGKQNHQEVGKLSPSSLRTMESRRRVSSPWKVRIFHRALKRT